MVKHPTPTVNASADACTDPITIDLNQKTYGADTSYFDYRDCMDSPSASYAIHICTTSDTLALPDHNWWTTQYEEDDTCHLVLTEVEDMCAEYPALARVYENFKTVYDLVKQDWKGKIDAENNS